MEETTQEIKALLKDLLHEVARLRERVTELERRLEVVPPPPTRRVSFALGAESYESMGRLYSEGYHICPVAYGQVRDEGECLFCVSILESR